MIRFVSKLLLFPLQLLAFSSLLFFGVLWLQTQTVDGEQIRNALRDALSRKTGRAVSIGEAKVTFSWPPQVIIKNVSIPNRRGGTRRPMLRVKRVTANLNPYHLIVGGRTISRTVFHNPEILIERGRDGRLNWGGGARGPAAALAHAARVVGSKKIVISGGRLVVRDLRKGSTIVVPLQLVDVEPGLGRRGKAGGGGAK